MQDILSLIAAEGDSYSTTYRGYEIELRRWRQSSQLIHWCGYVAVPSNHPFFNCAPRGGEYIDDVISVHGGVTWKKFGFRTLNPEKYYLGFHCSHNGDLWNLSYPSGEYRTREYTLAEAIRMVDALIDYAVNYPNLRLGQIKAMLLDLKPHTSGATAFNIQRAIMALERD